MLIAEGGMTFFVRRVAMFWNFGLNIEKEDENTNSVWTKMGTICFRNDHGKDGEKNIKKFVDTIFPR